MDWNPMAVIDKANFGSTDEKAAGAAVIAYISLLWIPQSSGFRAMPETQKALVCARNLVSTICGIDEETVQNACEQLAAEKAA